MLSQSPDQASGGQPRAQRIKKKGLPEATALHKVPDIPPPPLRSLAKRHRVSQSLKAHP